MRKPLYLRSHYEEADKADERDKKITKLAKDKGTSWSGAVRIMIDAYKK